MEFDDSVFFLTFIFLLFFFHTLASLIKILMFAYKFEKKNGAFENKKVKLENRSTLFIYVPYKLNLT